MSGALPAADLEVTAVAPAGRQPPGRRVARRWLGRGLAAVLLALAGVIGLAAATLSFSIVNSPSVSDAPARVHAILAAHHAPSDNGDVPPRVASALLATEDSRFYHDPALDPRGVVRAAVGVITSNGNDGGATIEQQLAKLLYVPGTTVGAEFKQVGVAFRLDEHFPKRVILAMYLDAAYFGDGAYGVTAASLHYFGVPADRLSWAQATLLAGLVQAPTEYDPHGHLSRAKARQAHVLARLVATHFFSPTEARAILDQPLDSRLTFSG